MLNSISIKQLRRYPVYLKYLISMRDSGVTVITSPIIARALELSEELVRKDLQAVTSVKGVPSKGRDINCLINDIEEFLGYHNGRDAIIVGVGHLGMAFMNFSGFEEYGLNILLGFDIDPQIIGQEINGKKIFSMDKLEDLIKRLNIHLAILTTPSDVSQEVAKRLEKAGIRAIWNFSSERLDVSENVVVENVNLASSLAVLSHKLEKKLGGMDNE